MNARAAILALAAAAALWAPSGATATQRLALLPFQTISTGSAALPLLAAELGRALSARGFEVVAGEPVERFLASARIRYVDSLSVEQARQLSAELGVDGLLMGSLLVYQGPPVQAQAVPEITLQARVVSGDGEPLWSQVVSVRGSDTENALGFGAILELEPLLPTAVRRLVGSLPQPLARVRLDHLAGPFGLPRVFHSRVFGLRPGPIMVMPLQDLSDQPGAARIVQSVLQRNLASRRGLELVEAAAVRKAVVDQGLPSPAAMRPDQVIQLARAVGTRYLLSGAVLGYGLGTLVDGVAGREVELYLSMIDVESGYVVWSGMHRRTGEEFEGLFKMGAIVSMPMLADRVAAELIEALARS